MPPVLQRTPLARDVERPRRLPLQQLLDHRLDVFLRERLPQWHRQPLLDLRGFQHLLGLLQRLEEVLAEDDELGLVLERDVGLFGLLVVALEFLEGEVFTLFEGAVYFAG